jgi:DNA-nicking Smr family endonuclease
MGDKRRRHDLSPEDRALWQRVTEGVAPLRRPGRKTPAVPRPDDSPSSPPASGSAGGQDDAAPPPRMLAAGPPAPKPATAVRPPERKPGLPALDRKLARRIGRGTRPVDAIIDLHGLTQQEAHARLLAFLRNARASGHRLVLVVTGKGEPAPFADWWTPGSRGVLRRAVPDWLATPAFRALIVAYERAHRHRGGDGAIYVQLRRPERERGT